MTIINATSRVKKEEEDASKSELSVKLLRKLENVFFLFLMAYSMQKMRFPLYNDLWALRIQDGGKFPMANIKSSEVSSISSANLTGFNSVSIVE
jgi:low temperature requirement protein LtrA